MGCYSIDWIIDCYSISGSCHGYIQRWGEDNNSSNNTVSLRNVLPVDVLLFYWLMFHCHFMTIGSDGSKIKHTHSNNTVSLRNVPLPVGVLLFFRLIFHCRFMTIASDGGKQQQQRQSDERTPCCSVHWCFIGRAMTIYCNEGQKKPNNTNVSLRNVLSGGGLLFCWLMFRGRAVCRGPEINKKV